MEPAVQKPCGNQYGRELSEIKWEKNCSDSTQ